MKKIFAILSLISLSATAAAQYMIVGKDSISLAEFKKDNDYGLKENGIEKTLATTQDFLLLQQLAAEKKADTTASFRERMGEKERELRRDFFFPKSVVEPVLAEYMNDLQTEKEVQIFMVRKEDGDKNNYRDIYDQVKSGKMTMNDAITTYGKSDPAPIFIKPGSIDSRLYAGLKNLPPNSLTPLYDMPVYVAFAKVISSRPTLGYLIFGAISFPKNDEAENIKKKIYADLAAGVSFQEVAKRYGANEQEKENGGLVMGSPTLPAEVYTIFRGKQAKFYTPEPILYGDNYFVFNIYSVEPYALTDKNRDFFLRDLKNSLYGEVLQDKMLAYLKQDAGYRELPAFAAAKKSFQAFNAANEAEVLYRYKNHKTTVGDIKKLIGDKKADAEKMTPAAWAEAMESVLAQDLFRFYSEDFTAQPAIKSQLDDFRRGLYSDFIFSKYLNEQIAQNPQWLTDYYSKNKEKFMWGNRAEGRVAIIADPKLAAEIKKGIKEPKDWEKLQEKYKGRLTDKKQAVVQFEKGEMSENADVFVKYKVPFAPGVHQTQMESRTLVIAIDKILPPAQMTQAEAAEMLKDAVTEQKLQEMVATQRAKTPITVEPAFRQGLEANFKK